LAQQPLFDACDMWGRTALMIAAANGHTDCAKLLLDAGSDPAAVDLHGHSVSEHANMLATVTLRLKPNQRVELERHS
jgi:ankyrin repeat protein